MKKIISHIYPIAIALLLLSCSKENVEQSTTDHEIELSAEISATVSTRATLITEESLKLSSTRLHVEAYKTGTKTNYLSSNALYDDGKWTFFKDGVKGYKYYWPAFNLDFFAYSPYSLSKTGVTMDKYAAGAPSFTYTGATEINGENQADDAQTEFAYAFESDCSWVEGTPQTLTFHHPFSLVDFKLDKAIRCTIKSINITNVRNNGTFTYSTSSPYAIWSATGSNNVNVMIDYSGMSSYSANGGIRYPEDVNGEGHLGGPFIVVPQDITDDTMIEVTYKALGGSFITVKSALGKLSEDWVPGNKYTYSLTLNGAANELFVAVKITDWVVEGNSETEVQ